MMETTMEPELAQAVRIVLKYEIQSLLSRLSDTGEEYIVLTASTDDRTCGHIGSAKGEGFVKTSRLQSMKRDFLNFCTVTENVSPLAASTPVAVPATPTNTPVTSLSTPVAPANTPAALDNTPAALDNTPAAPVNTPAPASKPPTSSSVSKPHRRKSTPRCKIPHPIVRETPPHSGLSSPSESPLFVNESGLMPSAMETEMTPGCALDLSSDKNGAYAYTLDNNEEEDQSANEGRSYSEGRGYEEGRSYSNGLVGGTMPGFVYNEEAALKSIKSEYLAVEPKKFQNEWMEEKIDISTNPIVKNELEKREIKAEINDFGVENAAMSSTAVIAEQISAAVAAFTQRSTPFHPRSRTGSRRKPRKVPVKIEKKSPGFPSDHLKSAAALNVNNNVMPNDVPDLINRGLLVTDKKPGNSLISVSTSSKNQKGRKSLDIADMKSAFEEIGNMAKCLICNKILANKNNRTFHWRSHVGDKRYSCDICHKAFTHPSNMRSHRKIHTDEKPFPCDLCDRRFRRRDYLLQHLERFHYNPKSSSSEPTAENTIAALGSESNSN